MLSIIETDPKLSLFEACQLNNQPNWTRSHGKKEKLETNSID